MEYLAEIRRLSNSFYADYPEGLFPEILRKDARAYTCLLIDLHTDYLICLPFRSRMVHTKGFHFSNTVRSSNSSMCRASASTNYRPCPSFAKPKAGPTRRPAFLMLVGDRVYSPHLFYVRKRIHPPDFWTIVICDDNIRARHPHIQGI